MKNKSIYIFLIFGILCLPFLSYKDLNYSFQNKKETMGKKFPSAVFLSKILKFPSQIILLQKMIGKMEKDLKEMENDLKSLLALNSKLQDQVKIASKFKNITQQQTVYLASALKALQSLKNQTAYTNLLVLETLRINQQIEKQSKLVSMISKNLEIKSKKITNISTDIKQEMRESVQQMRIMKEKLPKNIPM